MKEVALMKRILVLLMVVALMTVMLAMSVAPAFADHAAPGGDFSGRTFGQCQKTDATDPTVIIFCISPSHRGG